VPLTSWTWRFKPSARRSANWSAPGYALLKPAGRGLVLTDASIAAMQQKDQIFQLGENLPAVCVMRPSTPVVRSRSVITDGLPNWWCTACHQESCTNNLRLLCHESSKTCWATWRCIRLYRVITTRATKPDIKLYNHSIGR
jgi:LysR family transcriptional activator of nhaA